MGMTRGSGLMDLTSKATEAVRDTTKVCSIILISQLAPSVLLPCSCPAISLSSSSPCGSRCSDRHTFSCRTGRC